MSGTFERQIYDVPAYEAAIRQSTGPLSYMLDPVRNDAPVPARLSEPGFISKVGVSITHKRPLIDVESDLLGLDIKYSKDPNQMYRPRCPQCGTCTDGYPCGGGITGGCTNCQEQLFNLPRLSFNRDYTRISNPKCTAREVGINRFQPLNIQPQDEKRWLHQAEVGINYRMVVKDNHVPCIPVPMHQTNVLPTGRGDIPINRLPNGYVASYIGPMHKYAAARTTIQSK